MPRHPNVKPERLLLQIRPSGCLLLAGQRPRQRTLIGGHLHLRLFGHFQTVVDLDAEVAHRAFKFCMTEK
jgi:hypothetical protein